MIVRIVKMGFYKQNIEAFLTNLMIPNSRLEILKAASF